MTVGLNLLTLKHSEILALLPLFANKLPNKEINSELRTPSRNSMSMNMFILL